MGCGEERMSLDDLNARHERELAGRIDFYKRKYEEAHRTRAEPHLIEQYRKIISSLAERYFTENGKRYNLGGLIADDRTN